MPGTFLLLPQSISNLLVHPHGQRMSAAIAALDEQEMDWLLVAIATLAPERKAEMAHVLKDFPWKPEKTETALVMGLIDEIFPGHSGFQKFMELSSSKSRKTIPAPMALSNFANPALTVQSVWRLWDYASEPADEIREMLSINPNAPERFRFNKPDLTNASLSFLRACASYGDLRNPVLSSALQVQLFGGVHSGANLRDFYSVICKRTDIPPEFVMQLDAHTEGREYWELTQNPQYRAFCPSTALAQPATLDGYFGKSELRLHSDVSTATLHDIFSILETPQGRSRLKSSWLTEMVRLAAHPNSDEALMDRFFANPASNQLLSRDVPRINQVFEERYWIKMAESGIAGHDNLSRIENCPPETLAWAFSEFSGDSGDKSRFLTHKNFPWRGSSVQELCKGIDADDLPRIRAARFLFGKASQQEIAAEIENGGSREVLFAPNLSAIQLNKLVAARPELAVFAAIHPNAENIQVPAEHQKLVEMIRPQMHPIALGGRSQSPVISGGCQQLEI